MKFLIALTFMLFNTAFAADELDMRPEELLREMTTMESTLATIKPADTEKVDAVFPRTMQLLGLAQDILKDKKVRIAATVSLAAAITPLDDTGAAADVLWEDYTANRKAYESEVLKIRKEEVRNKLLIALRRYGNFDPNSPEIIGIPKEEKPKAKKK